jgi:DNA-binding response OmpR family regulator
MKKILVVDDDPNIITALTVRLQAARYEVLSAPDGFKGLKEAVTSPPNLILLDVCLPAVIGFAVAQRLQELGLERIPVIFITASKKEELRAAAKDLGAAGYLEKPYEARELLALIAQVLRESEPAAPCWERAPQPPVHQLKYGKDPCT